MPISLLSVFSIIAVFAYWKISAPKRAFRAEHIAPIEAKIRKTKEQRAPLVDRKQVLSSELQLFFRNFKLEIAREKENKQKGYDEIKLISDDISKAYENLNRAKKYLDSWHRKSKRTFFGNGGEKIEKSAWFSQSLNQRDNLKDERDAAYRRVEALKAEKSKVYENTVGAAKAQLNRIHTDKEKLLHFKRSGRTQEVVRGEMETLDAQIEAFHQKIDSYEAQIAAKWAEFKRQNSDAQGG